MLSPFVKIFYNKLTKKSSKFLIIFSKKRQSQMTHDCPQKEQTTKIVLILVTLLSNIQPDKLKYFGLNLAANHCHYN